MTFVWKNSGYNTDWNGSLLVFEHYETTEILAVKDGKLWYKDLIGGYDSSQISTRLFYVLRTPCDASIDVDFDNVDYNGHHRDAVILSDDEFIYFLSDETRFLQAPPTMESQIGTSYEAEMSSGVWHPTLPTFT